MHKLSYWSGLTCNGSLTWSDILTAALSAGSKITGSCDADCKSDESLNGANLLRFTFCASVSCKFSCT